MSTVEPRNEPVFWGFAFRPFFLLNGIFAVAVVAVWILALHGAGLVTLPADVIAWHAHEMLIGFGMAAVAGFVLTAVAVWTSRPPVSGARLQLLVAAWLLGRGTMALAGVLPGWLVGVLDLCFPVLLAYTVAREVMSANNRRNYPIFLLMVVLAVVDLIYHLGWRQLALFLEVHTILLIITVIAGRIVPNFTANWMRGKGIKRLPVTGTWVDRATIAATLLTGIATGIEPMHAATGVLAAIAAVLHAVRLIRWRGYATVSEPLLFVLHVAYAWLPIGYALTAWAILGDGLPLSAATHALTMGAMGSMILGVTTRVPLGHTGRALHAGRATVVAYCILTIAVIARVAAGLVLTAYQPLLDMAATGWIVAFGIFVWVYWPVLTGPRVPAPTA